MSDTSYGDFKQRREESVWHALNRLMVALIVFSIFILIFCAFLPLLKKQRDLAGRVEDLRAELKLKQRRLEAAQREEKLLRNDPEYIAGMARDKLGLMKEGETIFHLGPPPSPDPADFLRKP